MIPVAIALGVGTADALCINFEQRLLVAIILGGLCAWSCTQRHASLRLRALMVLALAF